MTTVTVQSIINAPADAVFEAVCAVEDNPTIMPDTVRVEFVGEQRRGVGTRFRETRTQGGQEMSFDLEVTGYDPEARTVRFVTDTHGTIWDTTVTVRPDGEGSSVTFAMDCIGSNVLKRFMNVVLQGLFRRGMAKNVAALKAHCEAA